MPIDIKIKYHPGSVKLNKIDKGDWIDLYASETVTLKKGECKNIPLGVSMKLPEGYEAHVLPRSSTYRVWKIIMTCSEGIIDNSYSGSDDIWCFPAYALEDTVISQGDRIAQFRIRRCQPEIIFTEVDELDDVNRGGFGSTGTR
jgi:dUTP pyrophosphatase